MKEVLLARLLTFAALCQTIFAQTADTSTDTSSPSISEQVPFPFQDGTYSIGLAENCHSGCTVNGVCGTKSQCDMAEAVLLTHLNPALMSLFAICLRASVSQKRKQSAKRKAKPGRVRLKSHS